MTKYHVSSKPLLDHAVDAFVYVVDDTFSADTYKTIQKKYGINIAVYSKAKKFTGKKLQTLTIPFADGASLRYIVFVGLGKKEECTLDTYAKAVGQIVRIAEQNKYQKYALLVPELAACHVTELIQKTTTVTMMAEYAFDEFVTDKDAKRIHLENVTFVVDKKNEKEAKAACKTGEIIGEAVNRARHWIDLPANKLTPLDVVKRAKELAKKHDLDITVFDEAKAEKLGMGGLKAVGMGSQHDAQMVIMQYTAKKKNAPTLALVGKGITFDSGGLNLKPTGYMETMKEDMSGAAAVINALVALAQMKPNINIVAIAALAENMIGGSANHPGDIITFYNGKTAVVGNTDAEGRLVLADALAYADKHFKPDAIVDLATLTGACSHAIGPFFSGLLTQDEKLAQKLHTAGNSSGDALWRLPLTEEYKVMVKSTIADLCNDGKTKYYAGATNGACFLSNFVGSRPWAHIDIAPSAFDVPDTSYYRAGMATGVGTRLLIDFVLQWN